jgi:stringent starvation protein B
MPFSSNKPYIFRAIHEWIIDNKATPYILLDATIPNIVIPTQYIKEDKIILNIDYEAITHWFCDNEALSFSARFNGQSMDIYIPMNALLAIYAQENNMGISFSPEMPLSHSEPTSKIASFPHSKTKKPITRSSSYLSKNKDIEAKKMPPSDLLPKKESSSQKKSESHLTLIK